MQLHETMKPLKNKLRKAFEGRAFPDYVSAESAVISIMNEYVAVLNEDGKAVYIWVPKMLKHPEKGRSFNLAISNSADMRTMFSSEWVMFKNNEGSVKKLTAFEIWNKSRDRREYAGIVVDNSIENESGALNLWMGYGCVAVPGDTSFFEKFLEEVICGEESDPMQSARELEMLLAWKIQNPTKIPEKAVVLRGNKGTGKNTLVETFFDILGWGHCRITSRREDVFGRFNAHLTSICALGLNEAMWLGKHSEDSELKHLVTEMQLPVERKHGANFSAENHMIIFMMANAEWVVPASQDERRYVVYDLSDCHKQNFNYFSSYKDNLDNGGREALLYKYLNMDLAGWHPRQMNNTAGLTNQKIASMEMPIRWLVDIFTEKSEAINFEENAWYHVGSKVIGADWAISNCVLSQSFEWHCWHTERLVLGQPTEAYQLFCLWADMSGEGRYYNRKPTQSEFKNILINSGIVELQASGERLYQTSKIPGGNKTSVIALPPISVLYDRLKTAGLYNGSLDYTVVREMPFAGCCTCEFWILSQESGGDIYNCMMSAEQNLASSMECSLHSELPYDLESDLDFV